MSSHEFTEWIAFARIEPIGYLRGDVQTALLCQLMANINTAADGRKFALEDFLIKYDSPPPEAQSPEEMLAQVEFANLVLEGLDLRDKED